MPTFRSDKVRLGLTIGDPAGIGPEVLVKALSSWKKRASAHVLVLGPAFLVNGIARKLRSPIKFTDIHSLENWEDRREGISCFFEEAVPAAFSRGRSQKPLTVAAVRSIELAARLAMEKRIDGIVTAPIHKAGLKKAGFPIPGHTEFLAKLSGTKHFEMMLSGGPLRVVLVTRHTPISEVPAKITAKRVEEVILMTDHELRRSFGVPRPRIAVCGLNPHAGEEGTIGKEEIRAIAPGVARARRKTNAEITGPLSPDVLFIDAYQGRFDAEVCMYHDQGLIPLKMISRGQGVNITLGLPFVRTSPDHGTAYDIASQGVADAGSMIEALDTAFEMARRRSHDARR